MKQTVQYNKVSKQAGCVLKANTGKRSTVPAPCLRAQGSGNRVEQGGLRKKKSKQKTKVTSLPG